MYLEAGTPIGTKKKKKKKKMTVIINIYWLGFCELFGFELKDIIQLDQEFVKLRCYWLSTDIFQILISNLSKITIVY